MKRFIRNCLLWSVGLLFLAVLLDGMITIGLRRVDTRKYSVWNDIFGTAINADAVIIGSSRAWCAYDTRIIDSLLRCNSYNLGIDGHPIDFQLIRYKTYRRFNPSPKIILINADFLSTLHNSAESLYEREQFFPYIHDKELINLVADEKHITLLERYLPLYRYFGYREDVETGIASFWGKKEFTDGGMYKGYRGNEYVWDEGQVINRDTVLHAQVVNDAVEMLDGFVADVTATGIEVIFVKSPVYHPLIDKFSNISETDSVFSAIADKYNVPVLDYYNCEIAEDSTFFYNPSHLNKKGAEWFTRKLCADINSL